MKPIAEESLKQRLDDSVLFRTVNWGLAANLQSNWKAGLKNLVARKISIIVLFLVCPAILFLYSAVLIADDFNHFIVSLHMGLLSLMAVTQVSTANYREDLYVKCDQFLDSHEAASIYRESRLVEERRKLQSDMLDRVTLYFQILYAISALDFLNFATMAAVGGALQPATNGTVYKNGVNVQLFIPVAAPFSTDSGLGYGLVTLYLVVCRGTLTGHCLPFIRCFIISFQKLTLELQLLGKSINLLHERVEIMYKDEILRREIQQEVSSDTRAMIFNESAVECLKRCIIHYQMIIQNFQDITNLWSPHLFFVSVNQIALFALALRALTSGASFFMASLCFAEMAAIYAFFWTGQSIKTLNETVSTSLYMTNWYEYGVPFKKLLHTLRLLMNDAMTFKAGPVIFNNETYSSILNAGYSYFNVMCHA